MMCLTCRDLENLLRAVTDNPVFYRCVSYLPEQMKQWTENKREQHEATLVYKNMQLNVE